MRQSQASSAVFKHDTVQRASAGLLCRKRRSRPPGARKLTLRHLRLTSCSPRQRQRSHSSTGRTQNTVPLATSSRRFYKCRTCDKLHLHRPRSKPHVITRMNLQSQRNMSIQKHDSIQVRPHAHLEQSASAFGDTCSTPTLSAVTRSWGASDNLCELAPDDALNRDN